MPGLFHCLLHSRNGQSTVAMVGYFVKRVLSLTELEYMLPGWKERIHDRAAIIMESDLDEEQHL